MKKQILTSVIPGLALAVCLGVSGARAAIPGVSGTTFNLSAKEGHISTSDGGSFLGWGYALDPNEMQYPGPTLILQEDVPVTVNLTNTLTVPVSIVFPGQTGVTASGGLPGLLTQEAAPSGGTVSYSFTPSEPGTYLYHSGTSPELQIEMGLVGAIIVRPTGFDHMMPTAYAPMGSMYDREFLFLLTEMDPNVHDLVEQGGLAQVDATGWFPTCWFINGRSGTDTMLGAHVGWLARQPYNCMPMMHPGDKVLMRIIAAGRDLHPFHTHGNNFTIIARDGRPLQSAPGTGIDLAVSNFTISVPPGGTADAIFTWTGAKLGWDMYGHAPTDPLEPGEEPTDHGKPFPVALPTQDEVVNGMMWSGSPFLGALGALPPGEGGFNPDGGYTYMWHSHAEKELTSNDIFPGGMFTMLMIEAPSVPIMDH